MRCPTLRRLLETSLQLMGLAGTVRFIHDALYWYIKFTLHFAILVSYSYKTVAYKGHMLA